MTGFYNIDGQGNITRNDGIPLEPVTYKQMCELIHEEGILINKEDGSNPTPEEIYNYSKTGELFMIHEWYLQALESSVIKKQLAGNPK